MKLTLLGIKSFRLLRATELRLEPPFTVIIGANQSGKNSVLDALKLLSAAACGNLSSSLRRRDGGLFDILPRKAQGTPLELTAELESETGKRLRYVLECSPLSPDDFTVSREELAEAAGGAWRPVFLRRQREATFGDSGVTVSGLRGRETVLSQGGRVSLSTVHEVQVRAPGDLEHRFRAKVSTDSGAR